MHGGEFEEDSADEPHVVKRLVDTFIESNQENLINNSQGVYDEHGDYNELVDKLKLNLERQAPGLFDLVQPERPHSAYERFQMESLERYRSQNTSQNKQDILDQIQRDWDNLTEIQRQEHEKTQTQLEDEYQQLMEEYKKLNRLPQKPSTPYNIYYQRRFHDVKAGNPSIDNNELTFRIFQEWNALDADQKEAFEVEFTMLKGKFEEEMKQYNSEANQLAIENYKKNKLSYENKQKLPKPNPQAESMEEEKREPLQVRTRDQVEEEEDPRELENILGMKTQKGKKYFLIQWEGQTSAQATWEDEKQLSKFKEFLEIFEEQYFIPMRFDEDSPIIQMSQEESDRFPFQIEQEEEKVDQRKNAPQKETSEPRKSAMRDSASKRSIERYNEEKHPRFLEIPQPQKKGRKPKSNIKKEEQIENEVPVVEQEIEQQTAKRGRKPKRVDQTKTNESKSKSNEKSKSKKATQNQTIKPDFNQENKRDTINKRVPRKTRVESPEDNVKSEPKSQRRKVQSKNLLKQELVNQTINQLSERNTNPPRKRGRPPKNKPQSLRTPVAQFPEGARSTEPKLNTTEKQLRSNPKAVKLIVQSQKKEEVDTDSDDNLPSRLQTKNRSNKKQTAPKRTPTPKRSRSRKRSRENSTQKQKQEQRYEKVPQRKYKKQNEQTETKKQIKSSLKKEDVLTFKDITNINQRITRGMERAMIQSARDGSKSKDKPLQTKNQIKSTNYSLKVQKQNTKNKRVNLNKHTPKVEDKKHKNQNQQKVLPKNNLIQKIKKKITKKTASGNKHNLRRTQRNR